MDKSEARAVVKKKLPGLIISTVIVILFFAFVLGGNQKGAQETTKTGCEQYKSNAKVVSRKFLENHLEFAGSSHIPSTWESNDVFSCNDKTFTFIDWVDASNAYGARKKIYYQMRLKFLGGEWSNLANWKEESFSFKE